MSSHDSSEPLRIGPFSLRLAFDGPDFSGIGAVYFGDTLLRSAVLPWTVYAESETGVRFSRFQFVRVESLDGGAAVVHFRALGEWLPRVQEADAMGEARIRPRRATRPAADFRWTFRPVRERVFENDFDGLAMRLEISSPGHPLHWIIEDATWEIGGEAAGATLIQQDISAIDLEQAVRADGAFSTIEKFHTDGWGGSYPMDMLPRAAGAAICDFQFKDDVAICLFAERPSLTRARLDKFADENVIHYTDRAYFPLTENARPPERKLLAYRHPAPIKRHEGRNLWLDCFMEVRRRILAHYDFKLEMPEPCSGAHLWDKDLKARMERWADPLERDLPEYARLGYKQVFIHGVWDSVTSDPNPPIPGNICCPYAFVFADLFGGAKRMKRLNDVAEQNDLRLMQWFSFHLSKCAPVWKEHPEWVLREANGEPWDAGYQTLWSGRIRSGYGDWFKKQVLDVHAKTGIGGIFWDSYQNLGVTCIDWGAPDKAPQADEIFRMQGEWQRRGFRQRAEIVTIFGVSQVATFGFKNDKFRRRLWDDFVNGDQAFALIDNSPSFFTDASGPLGPDKLNPERYFWMVAHRCVPGIYADPWELQGGGTRLPGGDQADDYARVNHLYNRLVPLMDRPRLQEGGTHVVWLDAANNPSVVWVFRDVPAPAGNLVDVETGLAAGSGLKGGRVYTFGPA